MMKIPWPSKDILSNPGSLLPDPGNLIPNPGNIFNKKEISKSDEEGPSVTKEATVGAEEEPSVKKDEELPQLDLFETIEEAEDPFSLHALEIMEGSKEPTSLELLEATTVVKNPSMFKSLSLRILGKCKGKKASKAAEEHKERIEGAEEPASVNETIEEVEEPPSIKENIKDIDELSPVIETTEEAAEMPSKSPASFKSISIRMLETVKKKSSKNAKEPTPLKEDIKGAEDPASSKCKSFHLARFSVKKKTAENGEKIS